MFKSLKDSFVPHDGNDHRPHFLRAETMRTIAGLAIVFELLAFVLPTFSYISLVNSNLASVLPTVLGTLTNDQRQELNLPELKVSPLLTEAATLKAQDMAAKGYFAHTSPEGRDPWYWLERVGYAYTYAGENLAVKFKDSADVTAAWMNSPTHRANIVKAAYTEMGTGIATGEYEGKETVFVAQVYGNPVVAAPKPVPTPTPVEERVETPAPVEPTPTPTAQPVEKPVTTPAPQTEVLGAEQDPVELVPQTENGTPTTIAQAPLQPTIAPEVPQEANIVQRAAASPHQTTNYVFIALLIIVIAAMIINIAIRIDFQDFRHPDLITNGLSVIAIIGAIILINGRVATASLDISQMSVEYDAAHNEIIQQVTN